MDPPKGSEKVLWGSQIGPKLTFSDTLIPGPLQDPQVRVKNNIIRKKNKGVF